MTGSRRPDSDSSGYQASESPRRRLSKRQADTVTRLVAAATEELRDKGYAELTVRSVAARAGVASATAYTYFASKDHVITELLWDRLHRAAPPDAALAPAQQVVEVLRTMVLALVDEPELAAAATKAMLGDDPDVAHLRQRIGTEVHSRLASALGRRRDARVLTALEFAWAGALMHAGTGAVSYKKIADQLATTAALIMEGGSG
jgi:AcrR family transcriptional regulator